jgi:hypothetical protein
VNTKDLGRMMKGLSTKSTKSYLDVNGNERLFPVYYDAAEIAN